MAYWKRMNRIERVKFGAMQKKVSLWASLSSLQSFKYTKENGWVGERKKEREERRGEERREHNSYFFPFLVSFVLHLFLFLLFLFWHCCAIDDHSLVNKLQSPFPPFCHSSTIDHIHPTHCTLASFVQITLIILSISTKRSLLYCSLKILGTHPYTCISYTSHSIPSQHHDQKHWQV